MRRPAQKRQATGILPDASTHRYAREVMQDSLTFLARTGHSPHLLAQICHEVCERLDEPDAPFDPEVVPYLTNLPQVTAYWHSDPRFKDEKGRPLKLPLRARGSAPSLASLVRQVFPSEKLSRVVNSLLRVGAIQQRGRLYESMERFLHLTKDPPTVHLHTILAVAGMLRTVRYNIAVEGSGPTLLERSAQIPCIPVRVLPEIHARAKREFDALLWKFDGYVRTYEVEPGSEPTTCFGLGVYAYEDPAVTGKKPKRAVAGARPARRRRRAKA
jgi:Family of unknown function (DUF6502)